MRRFARIFLISAVIFPLLVLRVMANSPPHAEGGGYFMGSGMWLLILLIGVAVPIAITCFSEWLVSGFFGIHRDYTRLIILTNLISQICMWIVFFTLFFLVPNFVGDHYVVFLLLLELPIYTAEFLVYKKKLLKESWQRCLLYTLTANTVSLLLGLLYNRIAFGL